MTIALKANAAGTQGEILLNGNPVAQFLANAVNFPGLAQSLIAPNGYVKLPGGLIIQWGYNASGITGPRTISFPIAFPTTVLQIITTADADGDMSAQLRSVSCSAIANSSFLAVVNFVNNGGLVGYSNAAIRWIALGY